MGEGTPESEELRCRLALARMPGLGSRGALRLLKARGSACAALATRASGLADLGLRRDLATPLASPDWTGVQRDLDWLAGSGRCVLTIGGQRYPWRLATIPDPPPLLFVEGDPEALDWPQISVVGSRSASAAGCETAQAFAHALVEAGLVVTSGLALGIDAAAHRGALAAGGPTVAVLGAGLDRLYPARHRTLAGSIARDGAVVSEFSTGTPPARHTFPQRNRVISGLSVGVLVVEASVRSGALISARHAVEQGREVFAIPGSIHNPLARGCHQLIRQGAKLVETVSDILEELVAVIALPEGARQAGTPPATAASGPSPGRDREAHLDADHQRLLDSVEYRPTPFDLLVARAGLTPATVSSMLLALELQGYIQSAPGGRYARAVKGCRR